MALLMLAIEVSGTQDRAVPLVILGMVSLGLGVWALREGLWHWVMALALVLPVFFTLGVGFFYFLLPSNWLTRIPVVILYGVGIYALLLTANIYTVSSLRTIALLRAAQAVGFVLTLITLFFVYDSVLSYRLFPWFGAVVVAAVSFPLFLSAVWTVDVGERVSRRMLLFALLLSFLVGQVALVLGFWPVSVAVGSLFLTTLGYIFLGISQHELSGRLFAQNLWEYLAVGAAVFMTMFLTTRWGG